jgi:hypothetical protein
MRTRYSESVRTGQPGGSVERTVSESKEVACEASRCAAAASVAVGGGLVSPAVAEDRWDAGVASPSGEVVGALTKKKKRA